LPLNQSSLVLAKLRPNVTNLVDFLMQRYVVDVAKDSLLLLYPNIKNNTFPEETPIDFINAYSDLVKDGVTGDTLPYIKFYHKYPTLTDAIIHNISLDSGIPIISNLNPFIANQTFTENKAAYFINYYPNLTRSFGTHKSFPKLVYLFTQIPKSTDAGIKTIDDFEYLVKNLESINQYINETKKEEEKIAFFIQNYSELVKTYDWDDGNKKIFEFSEQYPILTDSLLRLGIKRDYVISSIDNVEPYLTKIPEAVAKDFVTNYEHLVFDDGLNATDVKLLPYYNEYRRLTDDGIKELKNLNSVLFVLDSYDPYIKNNTITDFLLKNYIVKDPDLFKIKEYAHPLADPDEDFVNNISEMRVGRDIFFGVGNLTWTPTKVVNDEVYEGNIFVKAKSLRGILPSKLQWIPINYTQFPLEVRLRAFPNETLSEFSLIPSDNYTINSTFNVTDITGGREYNIKVLLRDKSGNQLVEQIKTPYVREFENLGKQLYEKGLIIGVTYFGYYPDPVPWNVVSPRVVNPLLGEYNVRDRIVQVNWAWSKLSLFILGLGRRNKP